MMMLLLLDVKKCNKLRITEDCMSARQLIKTFAHMCGVALDDNYIDFFFKDKTVTTFRFADDNGQLLEINRVPFTTRF